MIEESANVTVAEPFQVFYDGQARSPGESLTVPASLAEKWIAAGWATADTEPADTATSEEAKK